jgi:hypothetical protein
MLRIVKGCRSGRKGPVQIQVRHDVTMSPQMEAEAVETEKCR